jgi:hypothetical protein
MSETFRNIGRLQILELKITNAIPTEAERIHASDEAILAWYENLNKILKKVPRPFVFNVDEVVFSEWVDAKAVLVPSDYTV